MHRSDVERGVVAYLDDHDADGVRPLQDLVRIRSLARQEGTTSQPGTLPTRCRKGRPVGGSTATRSAPRKARSSIWAIGAFDSTSAATGTRS